MQASVSSQPLRSQALILEILLRGPHTAHRASRCGVRGGHARQLRLPERAQNRSHALLHWRGGSNTVSQNPWADDMHGGIALLAAPTAVATICTIYTINTVVTWPCYHTINSVYCTAGNRACYCLEPMYDVLNTKHLHAFTSGVSGLKGRLWQSMDCSDMATIPSLHE